MKRLLAIALLLPAPLLAQQPTQTVQKQRRAHVSMRTALHEKKLWLMFAGMGASLIFDAESTARCITQHPQCQEANPIFGPRPSRKRIYGIKLGLAGLQAFALSHYLRLEMEENIEWAEWCEANQPALITEGPFTKNDFVAVVLANDHGKVSEVKSNYQRYCVGHTHAVTGWPRTWQIALIPIGANVFSGVHNSARRFPTVCPSGTVCR